jgi:hypothetical protein
MNKKIIKLTEQDLHKIVKNSVQRVLKEGTNEMAISRIPTGKHKGKVAMDEDDYSIVKKAYSDIIRIMEGVENEDWDCPLGKALNDIWHGPVLELRLLFMHNMTLGEYQETHKGLKH